MVFARVDWKMTAKIKKVIAREGLVLLVFCALFILGIAISSSNVYLLVFSMAGYPAYLIIRFIIWAIRTLKKNEN